MTGYASATAGGPAADETTLAADNLAPRAGATSKASVSVELRSVNGRFLDLGFRLPDEFRALEPALRDLLSSAFRRGKIELRLNTSRGVETHWPQPQPDQHCDTLKTAEKGAEIEASLDRVIESARGFPSFDADNPEIQNSVQFQFKRLVSGVLPDVLSHRQSLSKFGGVTALNMLRGTADFYRDRADIFHSLLKALPD